MPDKLEWHAPTISEIPQGTVDGFCYAGNLIMDWIRTTLESNPSPDLQITLGRKQAQSVLAAYHHERVDNCVWKEKHEAQMSVIKAQTAKLFDAYDRIAAMESENYD